MADRAAGGPAEGPVGPLVSFGRALRGRGLPVGTGRILTFVRAVAALGLSDRDSLYWAGRTSMVGRREHLDAYDEAFEEWYRSLAPAGEPRIELDLPPGDRSAPSRGPWSGDLEIRAATAASLGRGFDEDEDIETGEGPSAGVVASAAEVLREKSFGQLTEAERAKVAALIRALTLAPPQERTRRTRPSAKGTTFDLRRTLRRSLRTQGEPFHRAWRTRTTRNRPLVLILDVSGSMAPYSRALIQLAYAAMASGRRVETFVFGTRLTRVTRTLRTRDPDRALAAIGVQVQDWEGGTRIGESLKALLDGWSQRAALRGATVIVCSDGLERGDPQLLREQMVRMRRLAHRIVWVNPLKGSPRYEPLARGMAAALPSVDVFWSGHNLESLEALAVTLAAG